MSLKKRYFREDIIEKNTFSFGHCPKRGGGFTHARIFWPFFHQEKVPKIGTFLLKTNDICMFFVIIIIKITIITNVIIIKNHYYNQWYFFLSYAQNVVLTSGKKMTKLPELGGGGGCLANSGNARKKTCILL